jgi:hypothetical protein
MAPHPQARTPHARNPTRPHVFYMLCLYSVLDPPRPLVCITHSPTPPYPPADSPAHPHHRRKAQYTTLLIFLSRTHISLSTVPRSAPRIGSAIVSYIALAPQVSAVSYHIVFRFSILVCYFVRVRVLVPVLVLVLVHSRPVLSQ